MSYNSCAFCGKSLKETKKVFQSKIYKGCYICDECISKIIPKYNEMMKKNLFAEKTIDEFIPSKIYEKLNEVVIGQEDAKRVLSVAIYNHKKRLEDTTGLIGKSNILMAGPSGSGKTLLARTLADIMDVPFVIADATSLTEAGYVGEDVESILIKLIYAADGDVEKAQKGIVYIDEIDKIAGGNSHGKAYRDPSKDGVQYSLLKLIEGSKVTVPIPMKQSGPMIQSKMLLFDTSKILFICGGAFEGMFDRDEIKGIGFNSNLSELTEEKKMDNENLKNYGMKSEFLGRLPIHVKLEELTRDELIKVLTEPKNSIVKEYKELLKKDGITLEFTEDALEEIADIAISTKVGARGLRTIIEDTMTDIMFDAPLMFKNKYLNIKEKIITITKDTVHDKKPEISIIEDNSEEKQISFA